MIGNPPSNSIVTDESITVMDLNPGTNYTANIFTLATDRTQSVPVTVSFTTVPKAVTNVIRVNRNTTSITLGWKRQADYKAEYRYKVETIGDPSSNSTLTDESVTVLDLSPGTNYTFSVFTLAADGTSSGPVTVSFTTVPNAVTNVTLVSRNTTSITLRWNRQSDYKAEYRYKVETIGDPSSNSTVNDESITVVDLNPGTKYTFRVLTLAGDGTASDLDTVSFTTVPNAVTNVTLVSRNTTSITLRWNRQADYKAEYRYKVESFGDPSSNNSVTDESITVVDLSPGTSYTFSVLTLAADGTASDPVTVSFTTVPNAVTNVTLVNRNTTSITLRWSRRSDYKAEYRYKVETIGDPSSNSTVNVESTTVVDLNPGTKYTFRVLTLAGDGTASDPVTVSFTTVPKAVTNVTLVNRNTTSITLGWNRQSDYKAEYRYKVETIGDPSSNRTVVDESVTVGDLSPGTNYTFSVFTLAADGTSSDPVTVSFTTAPNAVTNVTLVSRNTTSITLRWNRQPDYKAEYRYKVETIGDPSSNSTVNDESTTVVDLNPGTKYTFNVFTLAGDGTASDPVTVSFTTVPNAVTNVTLVSRNTTSITLRWNRQSDHKAEYRYKVETIGDPSSNSTVNDESITVEDLNPGTKYTFRVLTLAGDGTASDPITVSFTTAPNAVTNVTLVSRNTTSITLRWDRQSDYKSEYRYKVETIGDPSSNSTVSNESITVVGLNPGTNYKFSVSTLAGDVTASDPVTVSFTTAPNAVTNVILVSRNTTSITLRWDRQSDQKAEYRYKVETIGEPSSNSTVSNESITVVDLNPGTNYTFSVSTLAGDGTASDPVTVSFTTAPNAVTNVTLVSRNTTSITLRWDRQSDHKAEYRYKVETIGDPSSNSTVSNESITVVNLNPGTNYTFSVSTLAGDGTASVPVTVSFTTEPNEVQDVMVVEAGTNFVTLSWNRPPDFKEEYEYVVLTKGNPAPLGDNGSITVSSENATVKGLTSGTEYNFTVITLAADGTRSDSVTISNYTRPVQIPPENITVENNGTTNTLIVSWVSPSGNVEKFFVFVQDIRSLKQQTNSTDSTMPITFIDLQPGREYNVTVITSSGPFNVSSENKIGRTVPSVPGNIAVTNFNTNSISLNWGAPADMEVGHYTFNVTYSGDSNIESITANTNSTTISNLTSGTNYVISVATIGPGDLQSGFVETTQFTKPNPVRNVQIVSVTTSSITLNWSQPLEYRNEYSYKVETKRIEASSSDSRSEIVRDENTTVDSLIPGTNYSFTIITLVADNISADPVMVSSYTRPVRIPTENITVNNSGTTNTLIISWAAPPGNVENFFVFVRDIKDLSLQVRSTNTTLPLTFTNLRPGREYDVTVITNSGPFNETSDFVRGATVPSVPGTLNVTNFGTTFISLNWGLPEDMDNGSFTFNVTYTNGSVTDSIKENTTSTNITNLTSGTNYTISVATVGPGEFKSDFVSTSHFTKPNPVNDPQIVQIDTTSITLSWTRPEQYKVEYRYRILTEGNPPPMLGNGSKTVRSENGTVMGLTPGTNYTFSIITLAKDGTEADPVVLANYTEPLKIPVENITLSHEDTTDSLTISWIRPPGGVDSFIVDIEDCANPAEFRNTTTVSSSTNSIVFNNLRPGRLYCVNLATIAGPHRITSDSVKEATIPTPPGPINVISFTTSTIDFEWGRPENMDIGTYNFTVTYHITQTANSITKSEEVNKSSIDNLESGTSYTITIVTTIPQNLNSSSVTRSQTTKPNPVRNPQVVSSNTVSINLTWEEPLEYKSEYKYKVKTDGSPSSEMVVDNNFSVIANLTPGTKFTFTIFTLAADGTKSDSVILYNCTEAATVDPSSLKCTGMDLQPVLKLEWDCPTGMNTGFIIKAANSSTLLTHNALSCELGIQKFMLNDIAFFTHYSLNITTVSCGPSSTPTSIDCTSGITDPPVPAGKLQVPNPEVTHKSITFEIRENAFSSNNGPLEAIAVIVTKEDNSRSPDAAALETVYSSVSPTYVTQVISITNGAQITRGPALSAPITVDVGNNAKSHGYVNQELTPLTAYRVSLAGFTKIIFNPDDKINSNASFYSVYEYSEKIFLKQNPDVIIGAVVGTILGAAVIILLVVLLFLWKRRSKSNNGNLIPIPNIREARRAINVDYFEGYFSKQHADSDCGFAEEYEELKTIGTFQSTQVAQQPLNKPKNRYNNVFPYDASRVKLSVTADPSSDYINANFMPGYNSKKEFIAAQGPLMNTVSDFWRMIWEHYVPAIVMLTKCVEHGRAKCEQYWPTERPLIFEDKIVTLTSEIVLQDWTIRDFTIVKDKSGEKRAVRHFHFTGWPDHGVPSNTGVLIEFRNLVRQYINQYPMSGPTVVHCSAGVGRTGTFISIDRVIYQIDNERKVDIWGIVYDLRMNRPLMVQTESQYVFLNQCAMEYIKASKQKPDDIIYQNTPALIYENASAIRAAHGANGHAL
ncbi:receptor-type tyrosine-protein phosphatase eta [Hemiscyllium ocellatum]|uniref:receptor-type tyrosine-protein phosphatase eta n=1 Tax=Hemiscyllium ocellatum TaxID=170820 RepID=UPI002966F838|nr:receptor-type tyrosine-protein phosphatase eta [Hemiscyllium ocellatum]